MAILPAADHCASEGRPEPETFEGRDCEVEASVMFLSRLGSLTMSETAPAMAGLELIALGFEEAIVDKCRFSGSSDGESPMAELLNGEETMEDERAEFDEICGATNETLFPTLSAPGVASKSLVLLAPVRFRFRLPLVTKVDFRLFRR